MKKNTIQSVLTILVLMGVLTIAPVMSASAYELSITSNNLNTLNSFTYSGAWYDVGSNSYLLKYYGGGDKFCCYRWPILYNGISETKMYDYQGQNYGTIAQCVSFVNNLAQTTSPAKLTNNWYKGRNVVNSANIAPGAAIATFTWGWDATHKVYRDIYSGHVAIFRQYIYTNGQITGIMVWDQNYVASGFVGMHIISKNKNVGVTNANNYYVVTI
jgi:hypothetical protein